LRHCLPPSVRRTLAELPETLDETYERILREIPKSNRVHSHRLLQCLAVATRPLRVGELAEVLAVDFDATGGIPKLNEDLRWEDQEQAVLSACSSLIVVIEDDDFRVVQFSHFSVKEFLTSDRLATSITEASRYHHISFEESHTIMAQACLSVLLRLNSHIDEDIPNSTPLARYAAEHLGEHAEFENVLTHIRDGIDELLDADKPHFAAWLWGRNRDFEGEPTRPQAAPLYYVAEFGYRSMVDYLISKRPEDIDVRGPYGTPLHAALDGGHGDVALLLLPHCVDVDVRGIGDRSFLHLSVDRGLMEVTRILVERHASINARDSRDRTPLHTTMPDRSGTFDDNYFEVVGYLLEHGADVNVQANTEHSTPLHLASYWGGVKVAQLLLDHDVNINVRGKMGRTPLHETLIDLIDRPDYDYFVDAVRFLLDHDADVDALDNNHSTPLHVVSEYGNVKATRLLLEHGADVDALDNDHSTPLHIASQYSHVDAVRLLVERGANAHAQNKNNQTPIQLLMANILDEKRYQDDRIDAIRLSLELGGDVDSTNSNHETLLHQESYEGNFEAVQLLLEHGANINVRNEKGQTPLHQAVIKLADHHPDRFFDSIRFLLEHGADVDALDNDESTPLHVASEWGCVRAARLLLEHGASFHLQNHEEKTALEVASAEGHEEITQLLSEHVQSEQKI
jgi:ankyrin repeat protein